MVEASVQKTDPVVEETKDVTPPEQFSPASAERFSVEAWQDRSSPQRPDNIVASVANDKAISFLPELILTQGRAPEQANGEPKDASIRLSEIIKANAKDKDSRSGVTPDQRTALDIQRFIRSEIKAGAKPEELAAKLKDLPESWQVRLAQDKQGRHQFVISKVDTKGGADQNLALVRVDDINPKGTDTFAQTGARLAERLDLLKSNPQLLNAYMQGLTDFVRRIPEGADRQEFLKGFNDRLSAQSEIKPELAIGHSNLKLELKQTDKGEGIGLVLKDTSGAKLSGDKSEIEKSFVSAGQESEAALRRLFQARREAGPKSEPGSLEAFVAGLQDKLSKNDGTTPQSVLPEFIKFAKQVNSKDLPALAAAFKFAVIAQAQLNPNLSLPELAQQFNRGLKDAGLGKIVVENVRIHDGRQALVVKAKVEGQSVSKDRIDRNGRAIVDGLTAEQIQGARQSLKPQDKAIVLKEKDAQDRPVRLEQNGVPIRFEYEGNSKLPKAIIVGNGDNARKFNLDQRALAGNQLAYTLGSGSDRDTTAGIEAFAKHIKPLLDKANLKVVDKGEPPRILAIQRANGEQVFFKYGQVKDALGRNDNISEITTLSKDGQKDTWKLQPDGLSWTKDGGDPKDPKDTWKGFKRLDPKTGVLTEVAEVTQPANTKDNPGAKPESVVITRSFKLDGTPDQPVIDDGKTEKDRPIVREVRLDVRLAAINGALEGSLTADKAKLVREQFKDLSAEEIQLMRLRQPDLYENLEAKFKGKFGPESFQWREVQGHLRRTGQPGEREAIQLMVDAAESQLYFGKDRDFGAILGTTRRILAGLTEERRQEINQSLVRLYQDAGIKNGLKDLYSETGLAKHIYKHDDLHRKLIDYAIKPKQTGEQGINAQVEILQAAFKAAQGNPQLLAQYARDFFGGPLISKEARQKFLEQKPELPKPKSSEDRLLMDEVRDYLKTGDISARTEFLKAVSGFSSNDENSADNSFKKWTPEMRSQYIEGRRLAQDIAAGRRQAPEANSKDSQALDFYKDWQSVFQQAHWAPGKAERMLHKYEAKILFPENGILNEITDVGSQWLNWREEHNRGLKLNERDFGWLITGLTNKDGTLSSPFSEALLAAMHDNFSRDPSILNPIKTVMQARLAFVQDFNQVIGSNSKPESEKLAYLQEKVPGFKQLTPEQQKQALSVLSQGLAIQEKLNKAVIDNKQAPVVAEAGLNPNEKQLLSQYRKFLLEATQQTQSRNLAQAISDNHHTVWKNNSVAILDGIKNMNAQELRAYREGGPLEIEVNGQKIRVDNYRQYIDGRLDSVLGKDTTAREAARAYLGQLEPGKEKSDKPIEDTVAFKLLKASLQAGGNGDNRALVISNLAEALAKDKDLGAKLINDPSFERAIKHILGWDKNDPNYKKYIEPMLKNGILPANLLKEIFTEKIEHQRPGHAPGQRITEVQHVFNQRSFIQNVVLNLSPNAIQHLNNNPGEKEAFLKLLDPKAQELAQTLFKQGDVRPEDRARAFILGLAHDKDEVKKLFDDLSPAARLRSVQDYERKYGERLADSVVNVLGSRQQKAFEYLFRSNEWTSDEAYLNTLARVADTAYAPNAHFGTNYNTELLQVLTNFEKLRHEHGGDIPREILQQELLKADKAIQDFIKTKHETIEKTVDAIVTVAAIGASFFTGGASLAALARLAYWARLGKASLAGGVLGTAFKAGLEGKDFEAREILGDFLRYTTLTGTNLLGAEAILAPLASKLGSRLLGRVFAGSQREITVDGAKLLLSEASAQQFRQGLRKIVSDSLEGRITNLDKSIELLVKGLKTESGEVISATISQGLNTLVKSNLDSITKVTAHHFITGLMVRALLESQVSGLGGFAAELVDSIVKDGKIDPDKLQQAVAMGVLFGFGGRLGFESALGGGSRLIRKGSDWRHSLRVGPETKVPDVAEAPALSIPNVIPTPKVPELAKLSDQALLDGGFTIVKQEASGLRIFKNSETGATIIKRGERITRIVDSSKGVYKFQYDTNNRLTSVILPDGRGIYRVTPKETDPKWDAILSDKEVPLKPGFKRFYRGVREATDFDYEIVVPLSTIERKRLSDLSDMQGEISAAKEREYWGLIRRTLHKNYEQTLEAALAEAGPRGRILFLDIDSNSLGYLHPKGSVSIRVEDLSLAREHHLSPARKELWVVDSSRNSSIAASHIEFNFNSKGQLNFHPSDYHASDIIPTFSSRSSKLINSGRNFKNIVEPQNLTPEHLEAAGFTVRTKSSNEEIQLWNPITDTEASFLNGRLTSIKRKGEQIHIEYNAKNEVDTIRFKNLEITPLVVHPKNNNLGWPKDRVDIVDTPVSPDHVRLYKGVNSNKQLRQEHGLSVNLRTPTEEIRFQELKNQLHKNRAELDEFEKLLLRDSSKSHTNLGNYTLEIDAALKEAGENGKVIYVDVPRELFLSWRNKLKDGQSIKDNIHEFVIPDHKLAREHFFSPSNQLRKQEGWIIKRRSPENPWQYIFHFQKELPVAFNVDGQAFLFGRINSSIFIPKKIPLKDGLSLTSIGASTTYLNAVSKAIEEMPDWLKKLYKEKDIKVVVISSPKDYHSLTGLRSQSRGWRENTDASESLAFFYNGKIVLFEKNLPRGLIAHTLAHENGHGYDNAKGFLVKRAGISTAVELSDTKMAKFAFALDVMRLGIRRQFLGIAPGERKYLEYYLPENSRVIKLLGLKGIGSQKDWSAARSEVMAENFASLSGHGNFQRRFPHSASFLRRREKFDVAQNR